MAAALFLALHLAPRAQAGFLGIGSSGSAPKPGDPAPEWKMPPGMTRYVEEGLLEPCPFAPAAPELADPAAAAKLNARRFYMMGAWHLARGEYDDAQDAFATALQNAPDSIPIRVGVARAHLFQKRVDQTIELCSQVLTEDPHEVEARLLLAQAYEVNNDLDKAIEAYRLGLKETPESLSLLNPLGDLYLRRRDIAGVIEIFERIHRRLTQEQRRNLWVMMVLAQYYDVSVQPRKAIDMFNEALRVYPTQTRIYQSFIPMLLKYQRPVDALDVCKQGLIRSPGDRSLQDLFIRACGSREAAVAEFRRFADEYEQISEIQAMWGENARRLGDLNGAEEAFRRVLVFDNKHFAGLLGLAETLQRKGRNDEAVDLMRQAVAAYPDSVDACKRLGDAYKQRSEWAKAAEQYDNAIRLAPNDLEAYEELSLAYGLQGELDKAIEALERALAVFDKPDERARLQQRLGEMLLGAGKPREAAAAFDKALASAPTDMWLYRRLLAALLVAGQKKEAGDVIARGRQVFEKRLPDFETAVAEVYVERQMRAEAIDALRRAIQSNAGAFELRLRLIAQLVVAKRYQEAQDALTDASRLFGEKEKWKLALLEADLRVEEGRFDEALRALEIWMAEIRAGAEPGLAIKLSLMQLYALTLERQKRGQDAIAVCDEMLKGVSDEDAEQVHRARGYVLLDLNAYDKARESFEFLVARSPQNDEYLYQLGAVYDQLKRSDKAESALRRALSINPDNTHALNHLGYMLVEQDRQLNEALELIKRAAQLDPDQSYIVDSLGWAYFKLGDAKKAIEYLEKAAALSKGDPVIYSHLAEAYELGGNLAEAAKNYQQSLKLDAKQKDVEEKLTKVQNALKAKPVAPGAGAAEGKANE